MNFLFNPQRPLCFVCGSTRGQITLFTDETLAQCKELLCVRKKHNLKYADSLLPEKATKSDGYHPMCYKSFEKLDAKYCSGNPAPSTTALVTPTTSSENTYIDNSMEVDDTESVQQRFDSVRLTEAEGGEEKEEFPNEIELLDAHCFFCFYLHGREQSSDERDGKLLKMGKLSIESFRSYAERVSMWGVLEKIRECMEKRGYICYHAECENKFYENSNYGSDNSKDVYKKLHAYVMDRIVKNRQCTLLSSLRNFYDYHLNYEYKHYSKCNKNFFAQHRIEEKLFEDELFKKKLKIVVKNNTKIVVRKGSTVTDSILKELERAAIVEEAALILRDKILSIEPSKFPDRNNVSFEEIVEGECEVPEQLQSFYETVLSGENHRLEPSIRCQRLTQSFSQDAIYAVTKGKIKTSKHIILANCLKAATNTMTRSKNVVRIANRFGHCCSYEASQFYNTVPEHPTDGSDYDLDDHYEDFSDHGSDYAKNNNGSESSSDDD